MNAADMMKRIPLRRLIVMLIGVFVMGLGITLFRLSMTGNDPSTALAFAMGGKTGIPLSWSIITMNTLYFIGEIIYARKLIGIGTFINWFGVGLSADLWSLLLEKPLTQSDAFGYRLMIMAIGVLVLSFSASMYQTADLGIAPYDAISLTMEKHLPLPYFWCRIINDSVCAVATVLLGGIVGLGTLVCALGLGPFIAFFTRHAAMPMCGMKPQD